MANSPEKIKGSVSLAQLVAVLKKWIWLIVVITLFMGAVGFGYSKVKKPVYTANQVINYIARVNNRPDDTSANINAMRRYIHTVVDFCDEGVVLDCADKIYNDYLSSELTIDEYISAFNGAEGLEETTVKYFSKSAITAKQMANIEEEVPSFVISLSITGASPAEAKARLRVLALAIGIETEDAFGGVTTYLTETIDKTADIPVSKNTSTKKLLAVFMILGLMISLFVVYLIFVLDRTIKDKDTFEEITGSNLIAYIEYQED